MRRRNDPDAILGDLIDGITTWDMKYRGNQADGMTSPVQCAYCRRIYDLGTVEVTARYADCSMWKSPCCWVTVDDRGETGWKTKKDYYPLTRPAPGS